MYYVYMLRCVDDSIYTGITTDLKRRFKEHMERKNKCAKYTYYHFVTKIECAWITESRSQALKLEYYLKRLKKEDKESIINKSKNIEQLFKDKIKVNCYNEIKNLSEILT